MTQTMNFKRMEVKGASKKEALEQAPFEIEGDATQAYRNWKEKMPEIVSAADIKQFMLDYLKAKKCHAGYGYYITLEAAVENTRMERNFVITDNKTQGPRKYKHCLRLIDPKTNTELGFILGTKADAKKAGKEFYTMDKYTGRIVAKHAQACVEGEEVAFTMDYAPSPNTKEGTYLVFGFVNED